MLSGLTLEPVALIQHSRRVRRFRRIVAWHFGGVFRRGQAVTWALRRFGVQCSQQALASDFIQGQAVGAFGQVILHVLVALGQFLDQHGGAVEVGDHFVLVAVETLLDVIQLTLCAAGARVLPANLA